MSFIGKRVERLEDERLLRGNGCYVDDIRLPDMWHVGFVRSSHAHARIMNVDVSRALDTPGVREVLLAADLGDAGERRMPQAFPSPAITLSKTQYLLARGEVCYVGEAIAVVIADSRYAAEDGVNAVDIDYEPLPVVTDCQSALGADSARAHDGADSNLAGRLQAGYGDIDGAFSKADVKLTRHIVMHRGGCHSMEGRGVVTALQPGHAGLTLWTSTQSPHAVRRQVAAFLGWEEPRVRVMTPDVGGGFGPKAAVYPEELLLAVLALRLGVPLKWTEDRREHFLSTTQQRDQVWDIEIAATAEGRLLALRGKGAHDNGAYLPYGLVLPQSSLWPFPGPYAMEALDLTLDVAYTNLVPTSPVRGAGRPNAAFVMERCIDAVARHLQMDPAAVREVNFVRPDQFPYATGMRYRDGSMASYDSGDFGACLRKALEAAKYDEFARRREASAEAGLLRGIGVASYVDDTGSGPFEGATVQVLSTGSALVVTGAAGQGQGHATILAQICAERLGIELGRVEVVSGDTGRMPFGLGTFGSRIAVAAGSSVNQAAGEVAAKAIRFAAQIWKTDAGALGLAGGHVVEKAGECRSIGLGDIARALAGVPGMPLPGGLSPGLEATAYMPISGPTTASGTQVAEVEIDPQTGHVDIVDYVVAHDCGRMLNPMLVEGQIIGGVVHGIGNAFYERMVYDAEGQPLSMNYGEYLLPTAPEIPAIRIVHLETPSPLNPLEAKGAGEGGTIPAAAALIAAVEHALSEHGAHVDHHPVSPQDILRWVEAER
ncbi:xanthine dehydrogenase family protein molybdopterin-binding subunit [Variovorax paradoxus]|uniref:xanthine dehydrogenase family protein molybdopterin-binding subunit n=1 Tax=Variovorax paradoxus TaxID=34073 RepID=UPI001932CC0F|nr:xanthine dehydrogenase family protein molybdopterin-binding subunit [Variovorax paradoxus]